MTISRSVTARKAAYLCPSDGHSENKWWASREQVTGTDCPYGGHRVPKLRAQIWALDAGELIDCYFDFKHQKRIKKESKKE